MKRKSVVYVLLLAIIMTMIMMPVSGLAAGNTQLLVNNTPFSSNVPPVEQAGNLFSPAKELANALGGTFSYDHAAQTGTLRLGENELIFRLDNSVVKFNGKYIQASAPMKVQGNRFMIPVRVAVEKLGGQVYYREDKNIAMVFQPVNGKIIYKVMPGDSLWIISQAFGTTISAIKTLNELTSDSIYIGQRLTVKSYTPETAKFSAQTVKTATLRKGPGFDAAEVNYLAAGVNITVTGKLGEWFKVETPKGNGYMYSTVISVLQNMTDGASSSNYFDANIPVDTSGDTVTYNNYTVQKGDNLWSISEKFGITDYELAAANDVTRSSMLNIGQILKIPAHNIAVKKTLGLKYGEVLDWFSEGQYAFPMGKIGKLVDMETGKSFMVKRTMGANHSDTEVLTAGDAQIMKEIFGGNWSWNRKPFILETDGRRFAVSVSGMPHAGVDGVPYLQNVANRSDNWEYGPNYDRIPGNGMDGHFDLYFLNCLRHNDGMLDAAHQYNVLRAGGLE